MAGYPCPSCGTTDQWVAHYKVPESQGILLRVGADGQPEPDDVGEGPYTGITQSYDPDTNECYQCDNCSNYIALDGSPFDADTWSPVLS